MEHNRRNLQIFSSNSLVWNLLDNLLIWSYLARVSMLSPLTGLADEERPLMSLKAFFWKGHYAILKEEATMEKLIIVAR